MPFTNEFSPFFYQFLQFSPEILKSLSAPSAFTFVDRRWVGCSQEPTLIPTCLPVHTAFDRPAFSDLERPRRDPRRNEWSRNSIPFAYVQLSSLWEPLNRTNCTSYRSQIDYCVVVRKSEEKLRWLLVLTLLNAQAFFIFFFTRSVVVGECVIENDGLYFAYRRFVVI